MKSHTLSTLIRYFGDVNSWPFVWDETTPSKYLFGTIYFAVLAALRDDCDTIVVTSRGAELRRQGMSVSSGNKYKSMPQLFEVLDQIFQRDHVFRQLVSIAWETLGEDAEREVGLSVNKEAYLQKIENNIASGRA